MRDMIQHKISHYAIISILGIVAGLLVHYLSKFPLDDLWSLALFSSMSLGQWMFTCSLIVFFSKEKKAASFSVGLYVYFMFFVTGIGKLLRLVNNGYNTLSIASVFSSVLYGSIPAIICAFLALILFRAKKRDWWGNVFLILPLIYIVIEACYMLFKLVNNHTNLLMLLIDLVGIILYIWILKDELKAVIK